MPIFSLHTVNCRALSALADLVLAILFVVTLLGLLIAQGVAGGGQLSIEEHYACQVDAENNDPMPHIHSGFQIEEEKGSIALGSNV
jgi:hypothetical protein